MITSLDNKQVKSWYKLHQKKYRLDNYLILDESIVLDAYNNNYLETLIYTNDKTFEFDNAYEVSKEVLNKISKNRNINYLGIGKKINENISYCERILILDNLQDPLNIGRIMECCDIFGFKDIILSLNCADIYNEKCLEASKGSIYKLNILHSDLFEIIKELKEKNYKIYATGLTNNTKNIYQINNDDKMVFILGNEGSGVRKEIMDISDEIIKIDMANIDSLNVGMAGAIIMHKFKI